jgi:protein phosphatase
MAELRWGAATHEGQIRPQNEDNHHADGNLFVVADGMGGHLAGEVASKLAVARLDTRIPDDHLATRDDLVAAVNEANVEIYNASLTNPEQTGMGTTITAIAVVDDPHDGESLAIANVGDSRTYVLRHGRLRQVTIDHSFVQELVAEGAITRDEARHHPRRNIVTRALGIEPDVRVDSWTMPIIRGDRYLLCSDGLVDEVHDEIIQSILIGHPDDPAAAAQALVDAANEAGGRDNVTAVVIDVLDGDDPPDPTEEFDVVPLWSDDDLDDTGETEAVADPLEGTEPRLPAATGVAAAAALADGSGRRAGKRRKRDKATTPGGGDVAEGASDIDGADEIDEPAGAVLPKRRRGGRFARVILWLGFASVLVLGFAILAAWARSGYYVAFDDTDTVAIFQGRTDGFLWFEPTLEAPSTLTRSDLDTEKVKLVEQRIRFESQSDAISFISTSLAGNDASQPADVPATAVTTTVASGVVTTVTTAARVTTVAPSTTAAPGG